MRALRIAVLTLLLGALLSATAYGAGYAVRAWDGTLPGLPTGEGAAPAPTGTTSAAPVEPAREPQQAAAPPTLAPPPNVLEPGDKGEKVRELQYRLFQMAWWPELTTGTYGADTKAAVAGFQGKRGFPETGVVDPKTWKRLVAMTETPTHDQKFNILHPGPTLLGPGEEDDDVRDLQARLKQIAWLFGDVSGSYDDETVEAVRGFQEKRRIPVTGEVDQRTLDRLYAMTSTPSHEAKYNMKPKPGALHPECRTGRAMCVDKSRDNLRWVVDGEVVATVDVRFGSDELPTREGTFRVQRKSRDHVSSLYDTPMPFAMFFSGGQAVHYSPDFAANGYNGASHGCVNVRDHDTIAWLFDEVQYGDKVVVYWS
jgi:peptidoglycan hydrolase-like protein with peptidoglycan-binding domain